MTAATFGSPGVVTAVADARLSQLLEAARRGDGRAYAEIFDRYSGRVHGVLAAHGIADPEPLTNEVFIRTFLDADRVDVSPTRFTGQLFGLAGDLARASVGERTSAGAPVGADPVESPRWCNAKVGDKSLDQWLAGRVDADPLEQVMLHLTPLQRDVLVLRVIGRLSFPEIGVALGCRSGKIRSVWQMAQRALASHLV